MKELIPIRREKQKQQKSAQFLISKEPNKIVAYNPIPNPLSKCNKIKFVVIVVACIWIKNKPLN